MRRTEILVMSGKNVSYKVQGSNGFKSFSKSDSALAAVF